MDTIIGARWQRTQHKRRSNNRSPFVLILWVCLLCWLLWPPTISAQNIKREPPRSPPTGSGPKTWNGDLSPISPLDWGPLQAAHLLERTGFGGTPEEIQRLAKMAPEQAVHYVVDYQIVPNTLPKFVPSGIFKDEYVPWLGKDPLGDAIRQAVKHGEASGIKIKKKPGTPWLQPILTRAFYDAFANRLETERLGRWWANRMVATQRPLEEKMTLFWHGHFATSAIRVPDYRLLRKQNAFLRKNATGNFRNILQSIAKDPATLTYLENTTNVEGKPNPKFARVLIEQYSMGPKSCTKKDIQQAARAFTGWTHAGRKFVFKKKLHDDGEITFLGKTGKFTGEDVLDIILEHKATPKFISRKIYHFFVRRDLPQALEKKLANHFRKGKYQIKPFLKMLFLSKDFYGPKSYATQAKSPVHLVVSTYRKLGLRRLPSNPDFNHTTARMGQKLFFPLSPEGWKSGSDWLTPNALKQRRFFAKVILFPTAKIPDRPQMGKYPLWETTSTVEIVKRFNLVGAFDLRKEKIAEGFKKAVAAIKKDKKIKANIDLRSMLQNAKVETSAEAVNYFTRRFLRKPLGAAEQKQLVAFITKKHGARIDYDNAKLEQSLRSLLHLIMSKREYQFS